MARKNGSGRLLVAAMLSLIMATACSDLTTLEPTETDSPSVSATQAPGETTQASPPRPVAPKPVVVTGRGSKVKRIRLRADTPLVATASHEGSANFIVHLIPAGGGEEIFLFNEIGTYKGQTALDEISSGAYRLKVEADGTWRVKLEQPVPLGTEKELTGTFRGKGAKVLRVQVLSEMQPTVRGKHSGQANFIVHLIGYGDVTGTLFVFNEIGRFNGETVTEEALPTGTYLVNIQADGTWSLTFTP